jgi:hypothetical protein
MINTPKGFHIGSHFYVFSSVIATGVAWSVVDSNGIGEDMENSV